MFFPKLMNLSDSFSVEQLSTFDRYMASLSPAAQELITAEKLCCATGVEYLECKHFLDKTADIGLLQRRYALRCPDCDTILKRATSVDDVLHAQEEFYCHFCDKIIGFPEFNQKDHIFELFSLQEHIR